MDNSQDDFDPREFGLSADELDAVADRLYDPGDKRLEPVADVSARFGMTRSHIRGLADAIRNDIPGKKVIPYEHDRARVRPRRPAAAK